jgi:hypothetical protein
MPSNGPNRSAGIFRRLLRLLLSSVPPHFWSVRLFRLAEDVTDKMEALCEYFPERWGVETVPLSNF